MEEKDYKLIIFLILAAVFICFVLPNALAADCWTYTTNATCAGNSTCKWRNDTWSTAGWCEEKNCWNIFSQTECNNAVIPLKNCSWRSPNTYYTCERTSCYSYSGTSQTSCENNSLGLNCLWGDSCYQSGYVAGVNCGNYTNQSACMNTSSCAWGQCMERGCWTYSANETCSAGKDPWNGNNCTWSASGNCNSNGCWNYNLNASYCVNNTAGLNCTWQWNSCQETECYKWDFTNETACVNNTVNLSCSWTGSYCNRLDCWSYSTNATCSALPKCVWKSYTSSGWCEEINCWSWDAWSGGNESYCTDNPYNLGCIWNTDTINASNGWCYKNYTAMGCSNKTTERSCMDTYYCWWQYTNWSNVSEGGVCNEPGGFNNNVSVSILNDWNPGCYIFDMNATDCNNTFGCLYNVTASLCQIESGHANADEIAANGLNCTMINNSNLCNNIPTLSSCCSWNGSCITNKLSTLCRDQMIAPPEGAGFCEDYNSYTSQTLCEQIAGSPWYMPCKWNNSSARCEFKASDVFGNDTQSLTKIDNKINCKAAGGKWIVENYCEGNVSVPTGRCEYKFDEEDNCDKACFACERKDSSGNIVNISNARTACEGSILGMCEYSANTNAPNGIGYCKAKEQFKKGIAGNCDSVCGDCTYKGDALSNDTTKKPSYYCVNSKANTEGGGCKWIVDNTTTTGGYCMNKGEKTCEDTCDRCTTQTNCQNIGRLSVSNQSGSCKWQGDANTGSCVNNIIGDVEVCWDGVDNNDNGMVDCADASCFSDSFCGFVEGDCFGWKDNVTCISKGCEWVIDKWGSWCDFNGSQCWKSNMNETTCNGQTNCLWNNGTGTGWCEKDYANQEVCMGLGQSACMALNESGCNWTLDTWCSGAGNGTDWCKDYGGWCDHTDFAPKNCWAYTSGASECNNQSGCLWYSDQYSISHCEVNWSGNCWTYSTNATCAGATGCFWRNDTWGGWCTTIMDQCWSSNSSTACNNARSGGQQICHWDTWGNYCQPLCYNNSMSIGSICSIVPGCVWKEESGWCQESASCWNYDETGCRNETGIASGCRWKSPGWCDPKGGGFSSTAIATGGGVGTAMGADCYKYDGSEALCTNKTRINISCGYTNNTNAFCDVDWSRECWRYTIEGSCNSSVGCWWNPGGYGSGWCSNIMDQCWSNESYQSWNNTQWLENCTANDLCTNNSWNSCEPKCNSKQDSTNCTAGDLSGKCRWNSGWCNPKAMNDMFSGMEAGAPVHIASDLCDGSETAQASVDICGFGMKDMGNSYGFGAGMRNFENSSVCNKEKLSSFVMAGGGGTVGGMIGGGAEFSERTGNGNDTIIYFVYLDADGLATGGCSLSNDSSAVGYEFKFRYASQWNTSSGKSAETFNSYKCDDSSWKATDIKLNAWKTKMCSDIGGPMIGIEKADLARFPTLYDSTKDLRVYVMTIGNIGNVSNPSDTAGPGWTTPGAIDFEIKSAFEYGADTSKFEDILKYGYIKGEDCFAAGDEDGDGLTNCADWDCQYSSQCSSYSYSNDTKAPQVIGVNIEEYTDSALIMYKTNKPTNGTLELYGYGDTTCMNKTNIIYDVGILKSDVVRQYKTWHQALIYETTESVNGVNVSIAWPLVNLSTYNYKLKVCDSANRCAISKCSSFKTASSQSKCGYCNFVTRIKVPTGWKVAYDVDQNGDYEHIQGEVCGPNAGMKTNYTKARKVNIKLYKSDGSVYFEFINATLTKTGLNEQVRTISDATSLIHDTTGAYVGMPADTRDKIINNLHPEICRVKIPFTGTCDTLYHCNDSGANCTDRTSAAGGQPIDAVNCVWNAPFCEFSTYKESVSSSGTPASSSSSGSSGAEGVAVTVNASKTTTTSDEEAEEEDSAETGAGESEGKELIDKGKIVLFLLISAGIAAVVVIGIVLSKKIGLSRMLARRKKTGIVLVDSGFVEMLKEKVQGKNYKGKWLDV